MVACVFKGVLLQGTKIIGKSSHLSCLYCCDCNAQLNLSHIVASHVLVTATCVYWKNNCCDFIKGVLNVFIGTQYPSLSCFMYQMKCSTILLLDSILICSEICLGEKKIQQSSTDVCVLLSS